jgi:putative ABC transport system permease protein
VVTYLEGRPQFALDAAPQVEIHYVGPDHFRLLGVPVLAGRAFSRRDSAGAPRVVLLNRAAADRLWGTEQAIGRRLALANGLFRDEGTTAQVVGVVADVRYGPPADPVEPAVYLSALQYSFPSTQVLVRSAGDPLALAAAARQAVLEVDPGLPIFEIRTLAERIRLAFAQPRTGTLLLSFFALLALVLAALGVYGVVAYSMARRVRELGIRIALGAGRQQVVGMVLGKALSIVAAGLALGALGALALGRVFGSMLYDVAPGDPVTTAAAAVLLTVTAVLAALLPARRALRIDPVSVLRED